MKEYEDRKPPMMEIHNLQCKSLQEKNGRTMSLCINNNFECKWTKFLQLKDRTGYMDKKPKLNCMLPTHYILQQSMYRLKVKGLKKIFHANANQKEIGARMFTSEK